MNSSKVDWYTQKLAIQYRWGLLPTNRLLHKIGKTPTNNCPLCGEEDGGHHAISGCKELSAAYTRRHNDAGTEILEAIGRGTRAAHVYLSDVGFTKRKSRAEAPEGMQPHRFMRHMDAPLYFNPDLAQALEEYKDSVPDILLIHSEEIEWNFTIVELKYCRDTDPDPQQQRAASQHSALRDLIMAHEPTARVHILPLMLGVSGIIYESFMQTMKDRLGVAGTTLNSLARRLHFIAVRNLRLIWAQRCAILQNHCPRSRRHKRARSGRKTSSQPASKNARVKATQGTKRLLQLGEPEHRKRRKKR